MRDFTLEPSAARQVVSKKRVADYGEVYTNPREVNAMLDLVKTETERVNSTFLEPACGTGNFLIEILCRKLAVVAKRYKRSQLEYERNAVLAVSSLYGIDILADNIAICHTRLFNVFDIQYTALYNTTYKQGCRNTVRYLLKRNILQGDTLKHKTVEGEPIIFSEWKFPFNDSRIQRREFLFKHMCQQADGKPPLMKFDVIIGNPPYQLSDAGHSTGSSPIYHLFVEQAKKLNPGYLAMIIPARWFAGGKGLDGFRDTMLNDKRISNLVDFPIAADVFPGIKLIGGACYFLWANNHKGDCEVTTYLNGTGDTMTRTLNQFDTFVRFNKAISILDKVMATKQASMSEQVSRQKPFGLRTFVQPTDKGEITLYANKKVGKIEKSAITNGTELLNFWKVFILRGYGEGGETRGYPRMITGKPIVAAPVSACTETYIVIGTYSNENEAKNLATYLRTKFARFLVGLRKNTQDITKDRFAFVPAQDFTQSWTDEKLYKKYDLTLEEVSFIESMIRPMEANNA